MLIGSQKGQIDSLSRGSEIITYAELPGIETALVDLSPDAPLPINPNLSIFTTYHIIVGRNLKMSCKQDADTRIDTKRGLIEYESPVVCLIFPLAVVDVINRYVGRGNRSGGRRLR